jgi:hypothetical protein
VDICPSAQPGAAHERDTSAASSMPPTNHEHVQAIQLNSAISAPCLT